MKIVLGDRPWEKDWETLSRCLGYNKVRRGTNGVILNLFVLSLMALSVRNVVGTRLVSE